MALTEEGMSMLTYPADPTSADPIFTRIHRTRARAASLYRDSAVLHERCQSTGAAIYWARLTGPTRRLICVSGGATSASPTPDPLSVRTIRAKLRRGTLRDDTCVGGIVVARGDQQACSGCDRTIRAEDVEIRARFRDGAILQFHAWCFSAWHRAVAAGRLQQGRSDADQGTVPGTHAGPQDPTCAICGRDIFPSDSVAFIARTMAHIRCAFWRGTNSGQPSGSKADA